MSRGLQHSAYRLPLLSGLLLAFAYFPFGLLLPNLVALVPVLWWLDANQEVPTSMRLRSMLIAGLTCYLLILHWMYAMLAISWLAAVLYLLLACAFALCTMASLGLAGWLRQRTGWSFALLLPVCWLPVEWAGTFGDLRMTAQHLGHTLAGYPFLVQFADLFGPYGVGGFMLLVNALIYETVRGWSTPGGRRHAMALIALVIAVLGYDSYHWVHPPQARAHLRVGIVQPNIPLSVKQDAASDAQQWEVLTRLTRRAASRQPDLIAWPESAHPWRVEHWPDHPATYSAPQLQLLAVESGAAILAGLEYLQVRDRDDFDYYNAAMVAHPDGTLDAAWAAKVYLVPFTEGIPYKSLLGPLLEGGEGEMTWLAGGFTPGPAATTLQVLDTRIGIQICYEELFPDLGRGLRNAGAEVQLILTNDAWFGDTVFQPYQANIVRLRAIESRSSYVRVANTGISGFVDPLGRYTGWTALDVEAVEVHDVPLVDTRTLYNRIGDVAAWGPAIALPFCVVVAWRRKPRR